MLSAAKHLGAVGSKTPRRCAAQSAIFLLGVVLVSLLAACSASTAPVIKIGLVAPFEGRYRAVGYEAIYAARLAIRKINSAGGVNGFRVQLFALDDGGDPDMAIEQVRKLALDPQVTAVVGHYRPDTTSAAIDAYCAEALPLLAVDSSRLSPCPSTLLLTPLITDSLIADSSSFLFHATVSDPVDVLDASPFVQAYNSIEEVRINRTRPGPIALQTYDAMYLLFDALARDIEAAGTPSREGMARAMADSDVSGLGGRYRFDAEGNRIGAEMRTYSYGKDREPELIR